MSIVPDMPETVSLLATNFFQVLHLCYFHLPEIAVLWLRQTAQDLLAV